METVQDTSLLSTATESTEQRLLKSLIKSCREFLDNKENLAELSENLKRIFYHGLSPDSNVSGISQSINESRRI